MAAQKLRILEPGKAPRDVDIVSGLTIGRAKTNACVLEDSAASSEHARVVEMNGALSIQDLGSANKTRVENGPALTKDMAVPLFAGMRFTIGGTKIEVVGSESGADATQQRNANTDAATDFQTRVQPARPAAANTQDAGTVPRMSNADATVMRAPAGGGADATVQRTPARAAPAEMPTSVPARPPTPAPPPSAPPAQAPAAPAPPPARPASTAPGSGVRRVENAPAVPVDRPDTTEPLDAIEVTQGIGDAAMSPALARGTLDEAKARLVFRSKKQGVVVAVTEPEMVVGRKKTGDVAIGLDDEGVSGRHALLKLQGRSFFVTDLESKNHTHIDKEQIAPKVARQIRSDTWLKFGTVDALFVTEAVAGMECPSCRVYDLAVGCMQESGALAGESLKQARSARREGKHPAEALIASGAISVGQWHDALSTARLRDKAMGGSGGVGGSNKKLVFGLVALVVVLIAVVLWIVLNK